MAGLARAAPGVSSWLRAMAFYRPPARPSRETDVPELPAEPRAGNRTRLAWVLAGIVLPVVTSLALVPVREEIDRSTAALVLVLPVVVVAHRGGRVPAEIAGASTADRAPLPVVGVELPVRVDGRELGRFILVPGSVRPVSREERLVAVSIGEQFGRAHGLP